MDYKLDTMIKVDETLCINCAACLRTCPGCLITRGTTPFPSKADGISALTAVTASPFAPPERCTSAR